MHWYLHHPQPLGHKNTSCKSLPPQWKREDFCLASSMIAWAFTWSSNAARFQRFHCWATVDGFPVTSILDKASLWLSAMLTESITKVTRTWFTGKSPLPDTNKQFTNHCFTFYNISTRRHYPFHKLWTKYCSGDSKDALLACYHICISRSKIQTIIMQFLNTRISLDRTVRYDSDETVKIPDKCRQKNPTKF